MRGRPIVAALGACSFRMVLPGKLDDESLRDHVVQCPIKRGRPQSEATVGLVQHITSDSRAVQVALGQRDENVEPVGAQTCAQRGVGHD